MIIHNSQDKGGLDTEIHHSLHRSYYGHPFSAQNHARLTDGGGEGEGGAVTEGYSCSLFFVLLMLIVLPFIVRLDVSHLVNASSLLISRNAL